MSLLSVAVAIDRRGCPRQRPPTKKAARHDGAMAAFHGRMRTRTPQANAALRALLSGCQPDLAATRIVGCAALVSTKAAQKKAPASVLPRPQRQRSFYGRYRLPPRSPVMLLPPPPGGCSPALPTGLLLPGLASCDELQAAYAGETRDVLPTNPAPTITAVAAPTTSRRRGTLDHLMTFTFLLG